MRMFFIYDTTFCKTDEDDPKDAVVYIFPTQLYENQYYSLCCQIVGIAKFLRATFSGPSVVVLDHGKFALHWSGKYLLVLGESSDIHNNILKKHLLFLCGIFCFYHGSISNLLKACKNDRKIFLSKMELAWSRYITFTECFKNLLQVSVNPLPLSISKKHAEAIAKANQLLHLCQMNAAVIAGAVFCNSYILSSQLNPELTSFLTLMSNANACAPVSSAKIATKDVPPDVELKYVYLNQKIIQSILKYNHSLVGTSVRIKMNAKSQMPQKSYFHKAGNSGSEGDVDSGNCTERVYFKKDKLNARKMAVGREALIKLNFKSILLCCSMHSALFRKHFLKCQNIIFLEYLNSGFISEKVKAFKEKAYINSRINLQNEHIVQEAAKGSGDILGASCHLLCYHHAKKFSTNFHSKSRYEHMNLLSTCDLEYSCYFCINHRTTTNFTTLSLKKWNSYMNVPDCLQHIPVTANNSSESSIIVNKHKKRKTLKCKIQILKCRSKSDSSSQKSIFSNHSKKHNDENTVSDLQYQSTKHKVHNMYQNICTIEKYWENMDKNDLEKSVLYVQRCGTNMILLLLNKNYDENMLAYLWNCGFTFLNDLDFGEKFVERAFEMDPVHHIILYDSAQEVLKESPNHHDSVFSEKHLKESLQTIQDHFQSDPKLHMFALLCANQSIFACQARRQSAFYIQQDLPSRKVESLCSLSKKAIRRLEKYLKYPV